MVENYVLCSWVVILFLLAGFFILLWAYFPTMQPYKKMEPFNPYGCPIRTNLPNGLKHYWETVPEPGDYEPIMALPVGANTNLSVMGTNACASGVNGVNKQSFSTPYGKEAPFGNQTVGYCVS
jgi:hypothetical protein